MVPAKVIGRWRGVDTGAVMELTNTGIIVVDMKDAPTLIGRCSFVGMRATVRYQLGAAICPEEIGQYTFDVQGETLTATDPLDSCADRKTMMNQMWVGATK